MDIAIMAVIPCWFLYHIVSEFRESIKLLKP